jgi:hypothetical protein
MLSRVCTRAHVLLYIRLHYLCSPQLRELPFRAIRNRRIVLNVCYYR